MKCNDCGNDTVFTETFDGDRTVRYDDDGNVSDVVGHRMELNGRECTVCESTDIDES